MSAQKASKTENGNYSQGTKDEPEQNPRRRKKAAWTIMVDIAADSSLANFAVESLKQLNETAGNGVVVVVQFALTAPGGQRPERYIFDEESDERLVARTAGFQNTSNLSQGEALADFLRWVYTDEEVSARCEADNYALILWGHGPELLFQPATRTVSDVDGDSPDDNRGFYLNPIQLRNALRSGIPSVNGGADPDRSKKPRIIAFDACSMSMFEAAKEIEKYADYMIASQEEVPDMSFPYNRLVACFSAHKAGEGAAGTGEIEALCRKVVEEYGIAYQDYICNTSTGVKRVTLSAIRLAQLGCLEKGLKGLAYALSEARMEKGLGQLLLDCRGSVRGFAGGLYVDIFALCDTLRSSLAIPSVSSSRARKLRQACHEVCCALAQPDPNETKRDASRLCILANHTFEASKCHGLSIYFPYMQDEELRQIQQPIVKGGIDTIGKGFSDVMNRAASNLLLSVRRQLIVDTETYYGDLTSSKATGWYQFIAEMWTAILTEISPGQLDLRYSAQQSAVNMLKAASACSSALQHTANPPGPGPVDTLNTVASRVQAGSRQGKAKTSPQLQATRTAKLRKARNRPAYQRPNGLSPQP